MIAFNLLFLMLVGLLVSLTQICQTSADQPKGYKGCYEDPGPRSNLLSNRIDQTAIDRSRFSGDVCQKLCREKFPASKFVGTKNGYQCYCSPRITTLTKVDDVKCNLTCSGRPQEICGGLNAISLYHLSDCDLSDPCQNGGRCIFTNEYKCLCKDDFSGNYCEIVKNVRWKGRSGSRIFYLTRQSHTSFQGCIDFCDHLEEKSRIAVIGDIRLSWFTGSGLLSKQHSYWVQSENVPGTLCFTMKNSHMTRQTSCKSKHRCLCQMRLF